MRTMREGLVESEWGPCLARKRSGRWIILFAKLTDVVRDFVAHVDDVCGICEILISCKSDRLDEVREFPVLSAHEWLFFSFVFVGFQ